MVVLFWNWLQTDVDAVYIDVTELIKFYTSLILKQSTLCGPVNEAYNIKRLFQNNTHSLTFDAHTETKLCCLYVMLHEWWCRFMLIRWTKLPNYSLINCPLLSFYIPHNIKQIAFRINSFLSVLSTFFFDWVVDYWKINIKLLIEFQKDIFVLYCYLEWILIN